MGAYWHWQNLNERKGRPDGSPLRHGRAWLHFFGYVIGIEWCLLKFSFGFGVSEYDNKATLLISIPLVSLHFSLSAPWRSFVGRAIHAMEDRECSVSIHGWTLWIHPWSNTMEWSRSQPWWMRGLTFHIDDFFLGRRKHSLEILKTGEIGFWFDAKIYHATYEIERRTWKRARWPFPLVRVATTINVGGGVPVPGKGENSWDCGDDGIWGTGASGDDPNDAVRALLTSVIETRLRYGGSMWQPQKEAAA